MSTVKTVVVMVEKWKGHSRQPQVGDLTSGLTSVSRKMPLRTARDATQNQFCMFFFLNVQQGERGQGVNGFLSTVIKYRRIDILSIPQRDHKKNAFMTTLNDTMQILPM